jgi:D-alanine-D-alanine ligase-like ATP-grasp enzyme
MNKDICSSFLKRSGFNIPKSENYTRRSKEKNIDLYDSIIEFFETAEEKGFKYPLIIKPATLSQGVGIVKIHNKEEAKDVLKSLLMNKKLENVKTFIIQEFVIGNDYRIVVLGDKILQAYKRVPFQIVGDGKSTINELIDKKINYFIEADRDKKVDKNDERILTNIEEAGYKMDDILEENKVLRW